MSKSNMSCAIHLGGQSDFWDFFLPVETKLYFLEGNLKGFFFASATSCDPRLAYCLDLTGSDHWILPLILLDLTTGSYRWVLPLDLTFGSYRCLDLTAAGILPLLGSYRLDLTCKDLTAFGSYLQGSYRFWILPAWDLTAFGS